MPRSRKENPSCCLLVTRRQPLPALEPGQQGIELVVGAAHLHIPVPRRLGPTPGPEPVTPAIAHRVLGAEVAVTATTVGQDLLPFPLAEGTGTVEPVPFALARPLALAAGQVIGRKTSTFCTGLDPKKGLKVIRQGNAMGIAHGAMALDTGCAGRRAA